MELQERLAVEIREAEARFKPREEQASQDEAVVAQKLAAVEAELAGVRAERERPRQDSRRPLLADYDRILRARGGLAVAGGEARLLRRLPR